MPKVYAPSLASVLAADDAKAEVKPEEKPQKIDPEDVSRALDDAMRASGEPWDRERAISWISDYHSTHGDQDCHRIEAGAELDSFGWESR